MDLVRGVHVPSFDHVGCSGIRTTLFPHRAALL